MRYSGALGTSAVKIFEATAAMTGLSERGAREAGFAVGVAVIYKGHHAGYYPGAEELSLKLVYDKKSARLLGAQAFGRAGVDKRIDVIATALAGKLTLQDLAELDLAYAPPYSTANDPVNLAAFIGLNDLSGFSPLVSAAELKAELAKAEPPLVLDVRTLREYEMSHLDGAMHIPVDDLRFESDRLPRNQRPRVLSVGFPRTLGRPHAQGEGLRRRRQRHRRAPRHACGGRLQLGDNVNWTIRQRTLRGSLRPPAGSGVGQSPPPPTRL
jgi:hypothetical protein